MASVRFNSVSNAQRPGGVGGALPQWWREATSFQVLLKQASNQLAIYLVLDTGHEVLDTVAGGSVWQ